LAVVGLVVVEPAVVELPVVADGLVLGESLVVDKGND